MIKKFLAAVLMTISSAAALAVPFGSQSVLVVEDDTGKVLFEKNASTVAPIASLTKLMTAMVVLDAHQDMNEPIEIEKSDVDMLKHSSSRVPVGATIPRRDVLQLALVVSALVIDALVLYTMAGRIAEYGTTPNNVAALGENIVLLANLAWSAWLLLRFVRRRGTFPAIERWQTVYLPVYALWFWTVALLLPPLFSFR